MDILEPSEELMVRIGKGDEDAFEILVNRHQTSILNLTYRFIGDRTQAKDLAQEVFIRVWQNAKSYEPKAKFTTWIYRITANLCFNELKSARRKKWFSFNRSDEVGERAFEETLAIVGHLLKIFSSKRSEAAKSPMRFRACLKAKEWH